MTTTTMTSDRDGGAAASHQGHPCAVRRGCVGRHADRLREPALDPAGEGARHRRAHHQRKPRRGELDSVKVAAQSLNVEQAD